MPHCQFVHRKISTLTFETDWYADDVNILGGSVHTLKKTTDTLVVASKETGLEVNADKTKYMVMS